MIIRLRKRSLLLRRKLLMKFQGLEQTVPSRTRTMIGLLRMNFAAHRSSCCSQSWVHVRVINAHIKSEIAFAQRPDEGFSRLCWFLVWIVPPMSPPAWAHLPGQAERLTGGWVSETNVFAGARSVRTKAHVPARMGRRLEGKVEVGWLVGIVLGVMLGGDGALIKSTQVTHTLSFSFALQKNKQYKLLARDPWPSTIKSYAHYIMPKEKALGLMMMPSYS